MPSMRVLLLMALFSDKMGKVDWKGAFLGALLACILMSGCQQGVVVASQERDVKIDSLVPTVSHGFRVDYYDHYKVIEVSTPGNEQPVRYVLCARDVQLPGSLHDAIRIETPVTRLGCLSTTHIGAMSLLDARTRIAVAANVELIYDSIVQAMVASGGIKSAGHDYQPDYEMIALSKPQLLFSDGEYGNRSQMKSKIKALGIKIVASRDYFEQEPLARAEWIKFFAAFIDKEKLADSVFQKVKTSYISIHDNVANGGHRPTVFCNLPYNGIWYMPCGKNYVARLIDDAGGDFLWQNDEPINGLNLTLNFEQVYLRASSADYWINPGVASTLQQIIDQDAKFKLFRAYREGRVYNCIKRLSRGGGMDMWETGTFRPDLVLSDLKSILRSSSAPVALHYYKQLQ